MCTQAQPLLVLWLITDKPKTRVDLLFHVKMNLRPYGNKRTSPGEPADSKNAPRLRTSKPDSDS